MTRLNIQLENPPTAHKSALYSNALRAPVIPRRVTLGKVESIPRSNGNDKLKWKKKKKKIVVRALQRDNDSRSVRRHPLDTPGGTYAIPCSSVTSLKVHNGRLFASRLCIVVVNTSRRFYQGSGGDQRRWKRRVVPLSAKRGNISVTLLHLAE